MRLIEKTAFWLITIVSIGTVFVVARFANNLNPSQLKELFYTGEVNGR